jgi:hypothetical protein
MRKFDLNGILTRERRWEPDWLILQAESLSRFAKEHNSSTALVYSALEARTAIEQLIFSIIWLCRGAVDDKTLAECKKTDGLGRVLRQTEPDYRKMNRFMKVCLELESQAPNIIEWDMAILKRSWSDLSEYCHFQHPAQLWKGKMFATWLSKGIAVVEKVFHYFETNMSRANTATFRRDSMPPEVVQAWEDFRDDRLNEADLKLRLQIMQPALRVRKTRLIY